MATLTNSYALANPISLIVDKPREEFTREDLIYVIESRGIERITLHYTALDGKYKELKVPVSCRYQAERILADGERVDGSSLFKGAIEAEASDLYVVPIYKSAFLNPFDPRSLDLTCRYLTRTGELVPVALDTILARAAQQFRSSTGMDFYAMGELEFFLLSEPSTNIYPSPRQRNYHASAPFVKTGEIVDEMVRLLTQITGSVKYAHSEVGTIDRVRSDIEEIKGKFAEQLEIEFLPAPIEDMGDHLVLARWLIRNVAYKHGCVATFTPKLEEGVAGNGFHVHTEVMKNGQNMMTTANGSLSEVAKMVIGGLCNYAESLTAFGNTVSSAYLRLVPNQEAPTRVCWSDMNRSAMIRVPLGWAGTDNLARQLNPQQQTPFAELEGRQTVELRSPDGSAIVHLLLAGIAMAAEWGASHREEALALAEQLYAQGNIFADKQLLGTLRALPKSCVESARILNDSRALYERSGVFPPQIIDYMIKLLERERDENMNSVLADLPADDRLHETRKIMHKDLHRN
jgi:glutamine synthetase